MSVFTGGANAADPGEGLGGSFITAPGTGRHDDTLFEEAAGQSTSGLGIVVTVRRPTGVSAGVAAAGVLDEPTYRDTDVEAYVYDIRPEDAPALAGIYQMGDILLGFEQRALASLDGRLQASQSETGTEGDRIIFNLDADDPTVPLEYRIVGQVEFNPFAVRNIVYRVLCRKLGLAQ